MSGCAQRDPYPAYDAPDRSMQQTKAATMPRPSTVPFTASEARKAYDKAMEIHGQIAQQETQTILRQIKAAADGGSRSVSVTLPHKYQELITKRLEALGYTVKTYSNQRDGDYTTVSF